MRPGISTGGPWSRIPIRTRTTRRTNGRGVRPPISPRRCSRRANDTSGLKRSGARPRAAATRGLSARADGLSCRHSQAGLCCMLDLGLSFLGSVARDPNALAVVDGELRLTYGQWHRRISALVAGLDSLGLEPGDHVVTALQNRWEA